MLLRLSASNHLSISELQELSLVASKLKGPESNLTPIPGTDLTALPSAVIYGANASGKTNFLKCFTFLKRAVLDSHKKYDAAGGVSRNPFALDPAQADAPTSVEVDFVVDNIRYQYGFECDDEKFLSEWLYTFPEGKRRKMYERKGSDVEFGSSFRGSKKILVDLMRPNSLFISTATQNDHEELSKVVSFFRNSQFSSNIWVATNTIKTAIDERTIKFLTSIGTGIVGYRKNNIEVPDLIKKMVQEFNSVAKKHIGDASIAEISEPFIQATEVEIQLEHTGVGGSSCFLGLERESSGTRRLIVLMNTVFKALDEGSLVIIDELDASLHTRAAELVLDLFAHPKINAKGAQLIATTHDTNLLGSACLRRDQIWFSEKDDVGASHLYPLSDIKSRQTDNFEQGYLEGRYGAVPFSGNLEALFGVEYAA